MSTNTDPPPGGKQDSDIWIHGDLEGLLKLTNAHKHKILNHDWLDDFIIDNSLTLLKRQFSSSISSLQSCQGVIVDPASLDSPDSPFIQIINTDVPIDYTDSDPGSHWITLSNIETISNNDEDNKYCGVYDSLNRKIAKESILRIASKIVLGTSRSSNVKFKYFQVQKQEDSSTCGLMAIANAVELAFDNSPQYNEYMIYNVDRLGAHLVECMETKRFSPFPLMCAPKTKKICKDLHIEEVLIRNLGMKDILTIIGSSVKGAEPQTTRESILYIISRIVMLDYNSRQLQLIFRCNESRNHSDNQEKDISNDSDDDDDDFESLLKECSVGSQKEKTNLLHPSDVITIIMNCCDSTVQQLLVQKMVMCQLAVPLVFTNFYSDKPLFLIWAMRLINMNLKAKLKEAPEINQIDYPAPIISAVRIGDITVSKSEILNNILCNQKHSTFFHKDCELGNYSRKISEGLIELVWYLPEGTKEDTFDNIFSIANLRGDAKHHSKQFEFVSKVSSVMLIFYSIQSLTDPEYCSMLMKLPSLNQQLIFIFLDEMSTDSLKKIKKLLGDKTFKAVLRYVDGQVKNAAMLISEIRKKINVSLKKSRKHEQLDWAKMSNIAGNLGIEIDKDKECCRKGKDLADTIINEIKSIDVSNIKNNVLPLQGQPWAEWSSWSKKQARLDGVQGEDHEHFISDCIRLKDDCLEKQCNLVDKINPVMSDFLQSLMKTEGDPETRIHFLQWMTFYLDGISHKKLPELQSKYHTLWNKLQDKQNNLDLMETQKKLDKLESDLISSSFGLEHFMRELGQIYEAIVKYKKKSYPEFINIKSLPRYAAELLLSGIPLEIMDGDVGHMPLTWVSAVFDSLKSKLGDKKVYIISVLGVQSSGKSTLLNAMFGLNFAVSAGRCTKGVFAQLIPVENPLNDELGYDYVLLLDTEGLRAPELRDSRLTHDNELATLVFGIGDVTIVNIKGENTAEIEDILQICVNALLRMQIANKSLKLQPGCYFVHQNVSDKNTDEKMAIGYRKMQEQLDKITKEAAGQEGVSNIQSFKDVIDFDAKENIWYFSSLWQGDPPMAPVNPNYCKKIMDLKTSLLKYPSQKCFNCLTLKDFQLRLSDLWKAILYESFIFKFTNGLEINAYRKLEEKRSLLSWEFRYKVTNWTKCSINEIQNCKENEISNLKVSINSSLFKCIGKNFSHYEKDLHTFFETDKDKDILVKWKNETDIQLHFLSDELNREAKKTCETNFVIRRVQLVQEDKMNSYKQKLHSLVKDLVSNKDMREMSGDSLNEKFAQKWNEWIELLCLEKLENKNVNADILNFLNDTFKMNKKIFLNEINQYVPFETEICDLDILPEIDEDDYQINRHEQGTNFEKHEEKRNFTESIKKIELFTDEIQKEIQTYLYDKTHQDYNKNFIYEIYDIIFTKIKSFNSHHSDQLHIHYTIKVTVHILRNVIPCFKNWHEQYRLKCDPQNILEENFKPQLHKFFHGTVSQCKQEITAADILSASIEQAILASVKRDLPNIIATNIRSQNPEFHAKIGLNDKILEDLGTENLFDEYIVFINNPNTSMKSWLKIYVAEYCAMIKGNGKSNLINDASGIVTRMFTTLTKSVHDCSASDNTNNISFIDWLSIYKSNVKTIIPLQDDLFDILDIKHITDYAFFEEQIIAGLKAIQMQVLEQVNTWGVDDLSESPHLALSVSVLGCTEQCPFCLVICTATIAGHEGKHHNPHHRPAGMAGVCGAVTQTLALRSCHVAVAGAGRFRCSDLKCRCRTGGARHPYADYGSAGPRYAAWDIKPDTSLQGGAYWRWVFLTFGEQFAERITVNTATKEKIKVKCPTFPPSWRSITWTEAAASIQKSI